MPETVLKVGVDSRPAVTGAKKGGDALDRLGKKAQTTEGQFKKLGSRMTTMRTLFASLGAGLVIREFARLLDASTTIDNKLRVVTNTAGELNAVFEELAGVSDRTRTSLEANAGLFQRIGLATKSLGLTFKEQTSLIEGFNQAMIISGTNAQEARAVTTQFAQGIGAGFKGDELRSIIEQAPRVAEVISDSLGLKSVQALKKFASEGKLTPQVVVDAFRQAEGELKQEFAKVNVTIGQGFQILRNAVVQMVRDFNNFSSAGATLGSGLQTIAKNLDLVAGAAAGLSVIILQRLVVSLKVLAVTVLANPMFLLAAAFAAAGAAAAHFGGEMFTVGEQTATGFQIIRAAFQTLVEVIAPSLNALIKGFELFQEAVASVLSTVGVNMGSFADVVRTSFNLVLSSAKFTSEAILIFFENVPAALELLFVAAGNAIITAFEKIVNGAANVAAEAAAIIALFNVDLAIKIQKGIRDNATFSLDRIVPSEEAKAAGTKIADSLTTAFSTDQITAFGDIFESKLANIQTQAKLAAVDVNELNNRFAPGAGPDTEVDGKALNKLEQQRTRFISGLEADFEALRSETGQAQDVVNEWYDEQRQTLEGLGLSWETYGGQVTAIFEDKLNTAYRKDLDAADDWASGIERAAISLTESIGTSADASQDVFETWFGGMEDSLTDFFTTGKLSVKDFADDMLKQITRIAVKQAIIKPLAGLFQGGSGGGGGGGISSLIGGLFGGGGIFKEGGLSTKPVETLPQFASGGLTSGGFPAILHPDEAVIPLSRNRKIPIDMPNGQGTTNNLVFNISTPDADSFKRSEQQIFARASTAIGRASKRNN